MAKAEAVTGKLGDAALVAYALTVAGGNAA
jgi:hypothetical protein